MRREPAFGCIALAVLLFGAVRFDDELRHQGQDHVVAGRDDRRRQHGMIKLDLAVRAFARLAMWAAELLRAKILGSVECDQRAPVEALERFHAAVVAQRCDGLIETALQMRGMHRASNGCDCPSGFSPCQTAYGNWRSCALP